MTMSLHGANIAYVKEVQAMPVSGASNSERVTLNIRIKSELRGLIDRAAKSRGKNRTDFILDAARVAAEEALLDQVVITANPEAYAAFLKKLDSPPRPNKRLRKTLQSPAPWDK